ncbi:hypothetical protein [Devosia sp.]|uniref:hypothetical protein n=1 Tax=Devosia sp. TaxID=1871048 RepID=UPI003F6E6953
MSDVLQPARKVSLRIDYPVFKAIEATAAEEGRDTGQQMQHILFEAVKDRIDPGRLEDYRLLDSLVKRASVEAQRMCRNGEFGSDITLRVLTRCMSDAGWARDYETYVRDNPFKSGNPRKGIINKELGFAIREAINGTTIKTADGKNAKVSVSGSIIQSYTPMSGFDANAVLEKGDA